MNALPVYERDATPAGSDSANEVRAACRAGHGQPVDVRAGRPSGAVAAVVVGLRAGVRGPVVVTDVSRVGHLAPPTDHGTSVDSPSTTGNGQVTWRGIPLEALACAHWRSRERLLETLATECAEAAERNAQILRARALRAALDAEPATEEEIIERLAVWGLEPEETAARNRRARHAASLRQRRAARKLADS